MLDQEHREILIKAMANAISAGETPTVWHEMLSGDVLDILTDGRVFQKMLVEAIDAYEAAMDEGPGVSPMEEALRAALGAQP